MSRGVRINGKKPKKGKKMNHGSGWTLLNGEELRFVATLLWTFNSGKKRLAVFSVPK